MPQNSQNDKAKLHNVIGLAIGTTFIAVLFISLGTHVPVTSSVAAVCLWIYAGILYWKLRR